MKYTAFGIRMKEYEAVSKTKLMRRTPVIIRLDGKCAHSFCRNLNRPYDAIFNEALNNTMLRLTKNIQNCVFGYRQSDEISLVLIDYETLETDAWFDYTVQKLTSVAASMATLYFNQEFRQLAEEEIWLYRNSLVPQSVEYQEKMEKYHKTLRKCIETGLMFDARAFNVPREEVTNAIYWRQKDAIRNSINMCGQYHFSHGELQSKSCEDVLKMLENKGIHWNTMPICYQRGVSCLKDENGWHLDLTMPILKDENRNYLEELI